MNPITHECRQGTEEWAQLRAKHFTASELSAAAGESKYQKRADLLKQKATGIIPEVDAAKQRLFDAGHAAEAAARPIVEEIIGGKLFPVTMSVEVEGMLLLASLDGIDMFGDSIWENKLLNESLKADVLRGELDNHYALQIEQQLLVSGAEKCYFTTSNSTKEGTFGMWYESKPELRAKVVSTWKQFAADLAAYIQEETKPSAVAEVIEDLPALTVQLVGNVASSNLPAFQAAVLARIQAINTTLVTDNDFATADKMVKFLDDGEKRLDLVKSQALAQTSSIDELFRTIDSLKAEMRSKRLTLDKLVKAEKENRKAEIVRDAQLAFSEHYGALADRVGVAFSVAYVTFGEAIKGLKSLDSMRDKVSVALANAKIEANAIADRIEANRKTVDDMSLFPDFAQVCTKPADDFAAMLAMRIGQRKEAEEKKLEEKKLEAERERIRAEEERRANILAAEQIATERRAAQAQAAADALAALPKVEPDHIPDVTKMVDQPSVVKESLTTAPTLKLGEINSRLGYTVSAEFLASLGFVATADRNAKLYQERDFPTICRKIADHTLALAFRKAA